MGASLSYIILHSYGINILIKAWDHLLSGSLISEGWAEDLGPPLLSVRADLTHMFTGLKVFHQRPVLLFTQQASLLSLDT